MNHNFKKENFIFFLLHVGPTVPSLSSPDRGPVNGLLRGVGPTILSFPISLSPPTCNVGERILSPSLSHRGEREIIPPLSLPRETRPGGVVSLPRETRRTRGGGRGEISPPPLSPVRRSQGGERNYPPSPA